jgi:hypothetical protein
VCWIPKIPPSSLQSPKPTSPFNSIIKYLPHGTAAVVFHCFSSKYCRQECSKGWLTFLLVNISPV